MLNRLTAAKLTTAQLAHFKRLTGDSSTRAEQLATLAEDDGQDRLAQALREYAEHLRELGLFAGLRIPLEIQVARLERLEQGAGERLTVGLQAHDFVGNEVHCGV